MAFVLTFSTAMNAETIGNAGNYQVAWASTRKVKRKLQTALHPVAVVSATADSADTVVTLATSATKQKFAKGGQLTIVSPGSVLSAAEVSLGRPHRLRDLGEGRRYLPVLLRPACRRPSAPARPAPARAA